MSKLRSFTASVARPLPVLVLADISGSMSVDGKIDALNSALADMVAAFSEEDDGRAEIHTAFVTFGGTAQVHQELASASRTQLQPFVASGMTPMGAAFDLARAIVEDREKIPAAPTPRPSSWSPTACPPTPGSRPWSACWAPSAPERPCASPWASAKTPTPTCCAASWPIPRPRSTAPRTRARSRASSAGSP